MAEEKKGKSEGQKNEAKGDQPPKRSGDKAGKGGKKARGAEGSSASTSAPVTSTTAVVPPRLLDKYKQQVVPAFLKQFNSKNPMQGPRLQKCVGNMGLGAAVANPKIIARAVEELKAVSGKKPVVTR